MRWQQAWQFKTANLRFVFEVTDCTDDPADSFDDAETVREIRNGRYAWFDARLRVIHRATGAELAADYLGACSYNSVAEFYESHRDADPMNRNCSTMRAARGDVVICHYFPDMIATACRDARTALARLQNMRVRT